MTILPVHVVQREDTPQQLVDGHEVDEVDVTDDEEVLVNHKNLESNGIKKSSSMECSRKTFYISTTDYDPF